MHCNAHDSQAHGTETYVLGLHRNDSNFKVAQKENEVIFLEKDYEINYEGFDPSYSRIFYWFNLIARRLFGPEYFISQYDSKEFHRNIKTKKIEELNKPVFGYFTTPICPVFWLKPVFITNKKEGDYLNSKRGKNEVSKSISDAILGYKSIVNPDIYIQKPPISTSLLKPQTSSLKFKSLPVQKNWL